MKHTGNWLEIMNGDYRGWKWTVASKIKQLQQTKQYRSTVLGTSPNITDGIQCKMHSNYKYVAYNHALFLIRSWFNFKTKTRRQTLTGQLIIRISFLSEFQSRKCIKTTKCCDTNCFNLFAMDLTLCYLELVNATQTLIFKHTYFICWFESAFTGQKKVSNQFSVYHV